MSATATSPNVCLTPELGSRMWVFRDGKRSVSAASLFAQLNQDIAGGAPALNVLLRAGELEAALNDDNADAGHSSPEVAALTNQAASALINASPLHATPVPLPPLAPQNLRIGTPEGFAFYLLHPLAFRELARAVHPPGAPAAVIGIRSIGAALSAVVAATLGAERITVRPVGHPYQRTVAFSPQQQSWVRHQLARNAYFYVVDEGPGFSGSSLLSTCEALEQEGVPLSQLAILCTAQPDPARLVTPNASARWQRFRSYKTLPWLPAAVRPENAKWYWADDWRCRIYGHDETLWPAVWRQVETPKFLARDDHRLFRFIGFGHYGAPLLERYQRLAAAELGPKATAEVEGFAQFWMEGGAAFTTPKWNEKTHNFMLKYLAARIDLSPAEPSEAGENLSHIARMVHFNTQELTGAPYEANLRLDYPIYADNRMMPHKFMRTPYGMRKLDGAAHGDDHFFPGACDIAWDIAGLFTEWRLAPESREAFLRDYSARTGDLFIRSRLRDWSIAYLAFRCGYSLMGANANQQTPEGDRLLRDAARYHLLLLEAISETRRPMSARIPA